MAFLFDPRLQKIVFTDRDPGLFFGSPVDMNGSFPLHHLVDQEDANGIAGEWRKCLLLADKQQYHFSLPVMRDGLVPVIFHIKASGFTTGNNGTTSNFVLFTVHKQEDEYNQVIDIATHDLDAPLRKLGVLVEKLVSKYDHDEKKEVQDYVKRINNSLASMRSLLDQLYIFSGINKLRAIGPCDLRTIIDDVWHELKPLVDSSKAVINIAALPVLPGDKEQYYLLFKNLLDNALRFAKEDTPPVITIISDTVTAEEKQAHELSPGKEYRKIEIADNGIGFSQEFAGKIFRPFIRLHPKAAFPGNGIGLAIVKRITINHGGIIYGQSTENAGARFIFILPETIG